MNFFAVTIVHEAFDLYVYMDVMMGVIFLHPLYYLRTVEI